MSSGNSGILPHEVNTSGVIQRSMNDDSVESGIGDSDATKSVSNAERSHSTVDRSEGNARNGSKSCVRQTATNDDSDMEVPMVWGELFSHTPVRKLVVYAQTHYLQTEWMNTQELADVVNVGENSVYKYMDDVLMLGVYEAQSEGRTTVYRPQEDSYVLSCLDNIEDTVRTTLQEGTIERQQQ